MGKLLFWMQWPRPQQRLWQELKKQGIIIPGPVDMDKYDVTDDLTEDAELIAVHIHYTMNQLGDPL